MSTRSEEYVYKYGCLVQFGVSYMAGFSSFADTFLSAYYSYMNELVENGYSNSWVNWQSQNAQEIINLYDQLKAQDLIPTS